MAIGELELLPAVREAAPETLIVADGFSCREQIAQCSDRHALHLAEVLQMLLTGELDQVSPYPESSRVRRRERELKSSMTTAGLAMVGAVGALALISAVLRRK